MASQSAEQQMTAEIFGSSKCTYCDMAKRALAKAGIPYTYYDLDEDFSALDDLSKRIGRWLTVPQIFINGEHVGGFRELAAMLEK